MYNGLAMKYGPLSLYNNTCSNYMLHDCTAVKCILHI